MEYKSDNMENYRIYFDDSEREQILNILGRYNDVVIDNVDDHSVGITIELDDSSEFYRKLMEEIDRSIYSLRTQSRI